MRDLFLRYVEALKEPDPAIGMNPARYWTMMFIIGLVAAGVFLSRAAG